MNSTASKFTWIVIACVQVFDILIHAATDQLEFLRVTANIVILVWLAILFFGKLGRVLKAASAGAIGLYFLLNLIFLFQAGFTNPDQSDAPRTMLFILVILTSLLSILLVFKPPQKR
jgi:hypothetical protein